MTARDVFVALAVQARMIKCGKVIIIIIIIVIIITIIMMVYSNTHGGIKTTN